MKDTIDGIYTVNLGIKPAERVLVFSDFIREDEVIEERERARREGATRVAEVIAEAGRRFCEIKFLKFPSTATHGSEPPFEAWEAAFGTRVVGEIKARGLMEKLLAKSISPEELDICESAVRFGSDETVDAVIALSNHSTTHTRFRELLTNCADVRYASMPLFEDTMLTGAMSVDWVEMEKRTLELATRLGGGEIVHITSPNGTSISFSIKDRKVEHDTGILRVPGSFGNLPAGEVFVAPVEGTAEGKLVLDWGPTKKFEAPITLTIKNGTVVEVKSSGPETRYAEELRERIAKEPLAGNIAELGVGTNNMATRPDNILETEKILGTVHIALGDNSTFGGTVSVPFHQDFIFFNPTLEVEKDGQRDVILSDGEPL